MKGFCGFPNVFNLEKDFCEKFKQKHGRGWWYNSANNIYMHEKTLVKNYSYKMQDQKK